MRIPAIREFMWISVWLRFMQVAICPNLLTSENKTIVIIRNQIVFSFSALDLKLRRLFPLNQIILKIVYGRITCEKNSETTNCNKWTCVGTADWPQYPPFIWRISENIKCTMKKYLPWPWLKCNPCNIDWIYCLSISRRRTLQWNLYFAIIYVQIKSRTMITLTCRSMFYSLISPHSNRSRVLVW